jgi:hypothetical protein
LEAKILFIGFLMNDMSVMSDTLPGSAVIVGEAKISDMIWIWGVLRLLISLKS